MTSTLRTRRSGRRRRLGWAVQPEVDAQMENVGAHARSIPAKMLGQVLGLGSGAVTRRRRGDGWTMTEAWKLADALGVRVWELIEPPKHADEGEGAS